MGLLARGVGDKGGMVNLYIRREQADKKGLMGGHKGVAFTLKAQVRLDQSEAQLVERYQASSEPIAFLEVKVDKPPFQMPMMITIGDLIKVWSHTTGTIGDLLIAEDAIKGGCQKMKQLLEVMATFGGEEGYEVQADGLREI